MSKRIASKAKAKRALRKGHHSGYKLGTASKNKGNVKKGSWGANPKKTYMPLDQWYVSYESPSTGKRHGAHVGASTGYRAIMIMKREAPSGRKFRATKGFKTVQSKS